MAVVNLISPLGFGAPVWLLSDGLGAFGAGGGEGGAATHTLIGANCVQANTCSTGAITIGAVSATDPDPRYVARAVRRDYTVWGSSSLRAAVNPTPWPPKDPEERFWVGYHFADALDIGETIVGQSLTVTLRDGVDADPASLLDGEPEISGGSVVVQRLIGGVDGANYVVRCAATTSAGNLLVLSGVLAIRTIR